MKNIIYLFILLIICSCGQSLPNERKTSSHSKIDTALPQTFDVFTSNELYQLAVANPEIINNKYKGKAIEIVGKVIRAYQADNGFIIELETNSPGGLVACNFPEQPNNKINIQSEQRIKGIYLDFSNNINIINCILK